MDSVGGRFFTGETKKRRALDSSTSATGLETRREEIQSSERSGVPHFLDSVR